MEDTTFGSLMDRLKKMRPAVYPIENRYLKDSPDYIRNTYLKILCTVLLCADNIGGEALNMLCRIAAGSGSEETLEEYFRQALDISDNDYESFIAECGEKPIGCRFVFDAMVIMGFEHNKKQTELMAQLCELLKTKPEEIRYIAARARAAIELSAEAFVDAARCAVAEIPNEVFAGYKDILDENGFIRDEKTTFICSIYTGAISNDKLASMINAADMLYVTLVNFNINLNYNQSNLAINKKNEIVIDNCYFTGYNESWDTGWTNYCSQSIKFQNCKKVTIVNSQFNNFSWKPIHLENVEEFNVIKSQFVKCMHCYNNDRDDWRKFGGVIFSNYPQNVGKVEFDGCTFDSCGGRNASNYYRSAIITNCKAVVKASKFKNCKHYNSSDVVDPYDNRRTLFTPDSQAIDCTFEDTINFN